MTLSSLGSSLVSMPFLFNLIDLAQNSVENRVGLWSRRI
jgi:hypothetical protein